MRRGGGRGHGRHRAVRRRLGHRQDHVGRGDRRRPGLDLYTVNLATVVDKYVGETEKNLERIFAEAGGVNAVLFFDEADAIFGKRSEVRDAHDRYANIESAYLLQRMETFDGLAVLATNLRANIDEAFTRRLDAIIDFPAPTPELRRSLWERCLAAAAAAGRRPRPGLLAGSFELAGGNIRSAATTAAYLAAAEGTAVGDAAGDRRRRAGVPQARPAGAGARVRPLLRPDRLHGCPRAIARCPRPRRSARSAARARPGSRAPPRVDSSAIGRQCTWKDAMHDHTSDSDERDPAAQGGPDRRRAAGPRWRAAAAEDAPDVLGADGSARPAADRRQRRRVTLDGRGGALAGARRHQLRRPPARAGRADRHGGAARARLRRRTRPRRRGRGARRRRSTPTPTRSARTSSSSATSTTPARRGQDHAGARADPRRPAAQRPGGRHAAPGGIKVSDPSDRFEREAAANAERVMAAPPVAPTAASRGLRRRSSGTRRRGGSRCRACSCSGRRGGGRGAGPGPVRPARGRRGRGRRAPPG